jgi:hypothetical protein
VEPTEVSVRGPKEILEVAAYIPTEHVDIEGRSTSFSSDYSLVDVLKGKSVEATTKVRVRVNIRPIEVTKTLRVPIHINTPPGYKNEALLPKSGPEGIIELAVKGPELLLRAPSTAEKISAFVVVIPDEMPPREKIPYSARVHLFAPPELAELKLAGEHYVDLEIRERQKQKPEEKEGP